MNPLRRFAAVIGIFGVTVAAQLTRGFISGTVTDSSGAVVPQAKITLLERSTGIRHAGLSNEAGVYRFVALEPGVYTVTFEKEGLQTALLEGVELTSAQEVVLNQALPVAGTATTVSVEATAAGAQLAKATPTVERTLGEETVEAMPLTGGREVADLALLAPGTAIVAGTDPTQTRYSSNGQRTGMNVVTVDGVDNQDQQYGFLTLISQPETVAEVQVRTNTFSAEYGRGLGSQVSIISRAGTNRLRGEVWDYYDSNRTSAASLANKYAGLPDVRFDDHQAGGSLGGPVRRNRTFFFLLGEYGPHREAISANGIGTITIPTAAGFAALKNAPLGAGQTPQSRQAILDSLSFMPEIYAQVRRYDQVRSVAINNVPIEFGTTRIGQSRPFDALNLKGRVDHRLSDRSSLTYHFQENYYDGPIAFGWSLSNNTFGPRFASSENDRDQLQSLSFTRIFSPALVNELRVSASRNRAEVIARDETLPRTTVTNYFTLGPANTSPFVRPRSTYEAQDILTWTRGRHSLKLGVHILNVTDTISGQRQAVWTFANFQDFFNNQATSLGVKAGYSVQEILTTRQNYFVQDDFKVRPDLTINLGVRYQTAGVPNGLYGATTPQMQAAGIPGPVQPDRNDVAPRFGFAYSPKAGAGWKHRLLGDSATVFRGGYGIGYGLVYEGEVELPTLIQNYPWNQVYTFDRTMVQNSYPASFTAPRALNFNPAMSFTNYPSNARNPTIHFYSFSIQREFARSYIVEAGYLGSRSYHLYVVTDNNPAILTPQQAQQVIATQNSSIIPGRQQRSLHPDWGLRTFVAGSGYGNYNAGYLKFDRRFSRGLLIGANYTWSKTLGVGESTIRVQNLNDYRVDYGRETIDVPHRFVIHYVWETPGRRFYSGWTIAGISQWQSGRPFSILTGTDTNGDGDSSGDRPDYNPAGKVTLDPTTGNWRTFGTPIDGRGIVVAPLGKSGLPLLNSMPYGGNLGRNTFRAPALSLWSLRLGKSFRIAERSRIEFRASAGNLFNHRNFGIPVTSMGSIDFGHNTSTPASRSVQLSAKLRF